ncbi:MAG: DNA (cytosine-5-)-methyltransferase [Armatimonadetes bacterium]|nr:DNA (cytosine-5-)-methyltransferase [Armatimonadota bacterium]
MVVRFIDLFCGIGGFRIGTEQACANRGIEAACVFSSDIDEAAKTAYAANFGEIPAGDIREVTVTQVPDHDLLLAGFPCQPFSIIGASRGFEDTRGTLFFEIARILESKRPSVFVLENVKQLAGHDGGRTLDRILRVLSDLNYNVDYRVLNALDFGLPQKRERVVIVGFREPHFMQWPVTPHRMQPLEAILEQDVPERFYASERIRSQRTAKCERANHRTIWHENKSGHVSAYPFSCALRAGASYNYLLVDGERRLTPREMLRLQGFPDTFQIVVPDHAVRRQAGNAVPVPMVCSVVERVIDALRWADHVPHYVDKARQQLVFAMEPARAYE